MDRNTIIGQGKCPECGATIQVVLPISCGSCGYPSLPLSEEEIESIRKSIKETESGDITPHKSDDGILPKYKVLKSDGTQTKPEAEYFILRLDKFAKDRIHVEACRKAVLIYAEEIKNHLPKLSKELIEKYG